MRSSSKGDAAFMIVCEIIGFYLMQDLFDHVFVVGVCLS